MGQKAPGPPWKIQPSPKLSKKLSPQLPLQTSPAHIRESRGHTMSDPNCDIKNYGYQGSFGKI